MPVDKFGCTDIGYGFSQRAVLSDGINFSQANNTFVRRDGRSSLTGDIDLNSHKLVNVADPSNPQDAATKGYVDINSVEGTKVSKGGDTMQGILNMNDFPLTGLPTGVGTGSDAISWSDAIHLSDSKVDITGDTMTGNLIISADGNNDRVLGCTDLIEGRRFIIPLGTISNRLYYVFAREPVVLDTDQGFLVKARNESICQLGSRYDPMEITMHKDIRINLNRITNLPEPTLPHEVANKMYVDTKSRKTLQGYIPHLVAESGYNGDLFGFVATASTQFSNFHRPIFAFNNIYSSSESRRGAGSEWASQGEIRNFWLQIKCPDFVRPWRIALRGRQSNAERIYRWRLEGSTDGETFTTLLEPPNFTYLGNEVQYFPVETEDRYNIFRLYCLKAEHTNPGISYFQLYVHSE